MALVRQEETPPPAAAQPASAPQPAPARPQTAAAPQAPAGEYTVKEGDSFWKIAASQLGNGARYQEIIDLNPQIDPKKPLNIGMKLKLPPR